MIVDLITRFNNLVNASREMGLDDGQIQPRIQRIAAIIKDAIDAVNTEFEADNTENNRNIPNA